MRRSMRWMTMGMVAAALLVGAWCTESHATAFGTLDNFDVVNDTGHECHGFEIELEDCRPSDVPYTFGGSYIRYGAPEVLDTTVDPAHPRTLVRYRQWNGTQWEATPVAPAGVAPLGHDCYAGGPIGNYATSGCEHYGVSLTVTPSKTTYRWLVAANPSDVGTTFGADPQAVQVPVPVFAVAAQPPVVVGAPPVVNVRAELEPLAEENAARWGEPQWMKVYKVESDRQLQPEDLNLLLLGLANGIAPSDDTEVETEWKLIQSRPGNAEGADEDADVKEDALAAGKHAVVRRYEFYGYTGRRDPENGEAFPCVNDGSPVAADAPVDGCSDLGDFVGAQNVAVDVELATADGALPAGEVGVAYPATALAFGGVAPYAVALVDGALPPGLQIDPATGVLTGTPDTEGTYAFAVHVEDAVHATVEGTFEVTIVPAVAIDTVELPAAVSGECYYAVVAATGGVEPYLWSDVAASLPPWAYTTDGSDVGGCPAPGDEGTTALAFTVTDAVGATATRQLALVVAAAPTETPAPTGTPVATDTPVPTATALPTSTPIPTETALPTTTPVVTETARPTSTPVPTVTALPTTTAVPTETALATTTPVPTETALPTTTPVATVTTLPTTTPVPTTTAVATIAPTPAPTARPGHPLRIKTEKLDDAERNRPYREELEAKGGVPPYRWAATGLPSGLVLDPASGIVSGRPSVRGRFAILVQVTDALGEIAADTVRLRVE